MKLKFKNPFSSKFSFGPIGNFFVKIYRSLSHFFQSRKTLKFISVFLTSLATILFLVEFVFAILIYAFKNDSKITQVITNYIPYPVALINFNPVLAKDFFFEKNYIEHFYNQSQKEIPEDTGQEIYDQIIDNKLLELKAPEYGVKITDGEVDQTIQTLIDQNGGEEEVKKVLSNYYGLNLTEFRKLVYSQLLRVRMSETVPVQIHASHILIKVDKNAAEPVVAEAKAKIDGIYKELTESNADFAEKAKNSSDDTGSNEQNGDLGWFGYDQMVKPFEDAAFQLELDKVSEPIRTDYGWHIIKVTEKKGYESMSFESWIESLKNDNFIKKLVKF